MDSLNVYDALTVTAITNSGSSDAASRLRMDDTNQRPLWQFAAGQDLKHGSDTDIIKSNKWCSCKKWCNPRQFLKHLKQTHSAHVLTYYCWINSPSLPSSADLSVSFLWQRSGPSGARWSLQAGNGLTVQLHRFLREITEPEFSSFSAAYTDEHRYTARTQNMKHICIMYTCVCASRSW